MDAVRKETEIQNVDVIAAFHHAAYDDNRKPGHSVCEYSFSILASMKSGGRIDGR
jgi:hypothetical protein